jgi:hypothetical protein
MTQERIHMVPEKGFLRIWHIVGDEKRGIPPLIPICKSSWLNGVKAGKYPKPIRFGERMVAWRVEDVMAIGGVTD